MQDCENLGLDCHAEITGFAAFSSFDLYTGSYESDSPVLHAGDSRVYYVSQSDTLTFSVTQGSRVLVSPNYGDADLEIFLNYSESICSSANGGIAIDDCDLPDYSADYQAHVYGYKYCILQLISRTD